MSLNAYLESHFVDKPTFASRVGVSIRRLDELIAAGAIPQATYTSDGKSFGSAAFGAIATDEVREGEYFRPELVRWAKIASQAAIGSERAAVLEVLVSELRSALAGMGNRGIPVQAAAIEAKIENYLPHFWNGTFGLCVSDPSSGFGIARKEILQERLTLLTENGGNPNPEGVSRAELQALIEAYAASAMPFSPAEYARSSRKRLVDDLLPLMAVA